MVFIVDRVERVGKWRYNLVNIIYYVLKEKLYAIQGCLTGYSALTL